MKPFKQDTHRFMVHNYVFDVIMPALSPAGFKVLMCAIRQTLGWADDGSPTGRRQSDRISYSQFMERTGIGSSATISRALSECLAAGYLVRRQAGIHPGTRKPIYSYSLNTEYEAPATSESEAATSKTEAADDRTAPSTSETEVASTSKTEAAASETEVVATSETEVTKERERNFLERKMERDIPLSDQEIKNELQLRMTRGAFETRIHPLTFIRENGRLRILGPPAVLPWVEHNLARQIAEVAGVGELAFEEHEP